MKAFLVLALAVTALFLWQRQSHQTAPAAKPAMVTPAGAAAASRPVSEHNWAKNSLDRAHEVVDQVRQTREQNDQR